MGKCMRAATAHRCYLSCEEGDCVYVRVCWRVHALSVVCVWWRGRGCVCCEGSRAVSLKVPKETRLSSCPFTLSWNNCILSIWGRETSPQGNGAKGEKTYDTATQELRALTQHQSTDTNTTINKRQVLDLTIKIKKTTYQRHGWVLSVQPRWPSWSRRLRWDQQTACCTGRRCRSSRASYTDQSLPADQSVWFLTQSKRRKRICFTGGWTTSQRPHLLLQGLRHTHTCPLVVDTKTTSEVLIQQLLMLHKRSCGSIPASSTSSCIKPQMTEVDYWDRYLCLFKKRSIGSISQIFRCLLLADS